MTDPVVVGVDGSPQSEVAAQQAAEAAGRQLDDGSWQVDRSAAHQGSRTLGLIAEVVLRVHPRPEASATTVAPTSAHAAARTTLELLASPLEPSAVDWVVAYVESIRSMPGLAK